MHAYAKWNEAIDQIEEELGVAVGGIEVVAINMPG